MFIKKKKAFLTMKYNLYINENKDKLKNEHIDFSYLKLTPQNLVESNEYNELYFKKIDEIENKISNGVKFKDIISELKIEPIIKTNYILNNKNDETLKKKFIKKEMKIKFS